MKLFQQVFMCGVFYNSGNYIGRTYRQNTISNTRVILHICVSGRDKKFQVARSQIKETILS